MRLRETPKPAEATASSRSEASTVVMRFCRWGWAGSWVEGGDAALVGAPGLMANAKDALSEAVNEHALLIDSGEPGLRSH